MQTENQLIHEVLECNVQELTTLNACSEQLKIAAGEANKMASSAVGYGQMAIRFAIKAGMIMNQAKEIVPHGEFDQWLETCGCEVSRPTMTRWMKLAKSSHVINLLENPDIKTMTEAYRATGILPEPEPKDEGGEGAKEKPPFTLSFKTKYHHVSEWSADAARDFIYEFDRIAKLASQLKTEFGL